MIKRLFNAKKTFLIEVLFIFLLSLTPLLWFKQEHIIVGLDSGYAIDHVGYFNQRSYTWLSSQNFGIDMSSEVGIVPYNFLPAGISMLDVPNYEVQKILLVGWFFILAFSIYLLASYLFPRRDQWVARIITTIIYIFNLHIYSFWLQGEQPIISSYVILPLFTLIFLRFAQKQTTFFFSAIYLNLVFVFFGSGGMRGLPLIGPVIVTSLSIFFYFLVINLDGNRLEYVKRFFKLGVLSFIFFVFSNAYFLLPFISSFSLQYSNQILSVGGIGGAVEWTKFISSHASFSNLFRLQGDNNWYDKPYLWSWNYLTNPILITISFVFPILAFIAPILPKERKERVMLLFFALLALFGVFLAAGAHPPLGGIYVFMMEHLPGFASFRSAYYKFIPIVYLSFSILIGTTVYYLSNKFQKKVGYLFSIFMIILILGYHYPYFTNSNFSFNTPFSTMVKIPDYVKEFAKLKNQQDDNFRTLVIPPSANAYTIKAFKWGYWSSYPIFPLITDRGFVSNGSFGYNDNENKIIDSLYESLRKGNIEAFLVLVKITNIKYLLVTDDVAKDYFLSSTEDPSLYLEIFNNNSNFFTLMWKNGPWSLFQITEDIPLKIQAFNAAYLNRDKDLSEGIFSVNYFPFITTHDSKFTSKVPIKGEIQSVTCLSCDILKNREGLRVNAPRILPTSFLYSIKLNIENNNFKKIKRESEKTDFLLGLSHKRAAELSALAYKQMADEEKWLKSASLLKVYWQELNKIYELRYKNSDEYEIMKKFSQYSTLEKDILDSILNNRDIKISMKFRKELSDIFSIIERFKERVNAPLSGKQWRNRFIFDVSSVKNEVYINISSLPKDDLGNYIFPSSIKLDEKESKRDFLNGKEIFIKIPKNTEELTLQFNFPNLVSNFTKKQIVVRGENKECISSSIKDYFGKDRYLLTAEKNPSVYAAVYLHRLSDSFYSLDSPRAKEANTEFVPDIEAGLPKSLRNVELQLYGNANDKNAKVYFCVNEGGNPEVAFKNIYLTKIINPQLYTFKKNSEVNNSVPKISFKKINPTRYEVNVKDALDPYILVFSEGFSPLWEIYYEGKRIREHFFVNGYANGWYIEKSGNYELSLVFKTQRLLKIGFIISVITLIFFIVYFFLRLFKYVKTKNK